MADQVAAAAASLAGVLAPAPARTGASWRWGTVAENNGDGTLEVMVGTLDPELAVTLRAVSAAAMAGAGDRVRIMFLGADAFVDAVLATSGSPDLDIVAGWAIDISGRTISVDEQAVSALTEEIPLSFYENL